MVKYDCLGSVRLRSYDELKVTFLGNTSHVGCVDRISVKVLLRFLKVKP